MFRDRVDAGRRLAARLTSTSPDGNDLPPPVVLGLPRGGVPVAAEVARALAAPLDVLVIRKVGVPWQPELAMGAVGEGGVRVLNQRIAASTGLSSDEIAELTEGARAEVEDRLRTLRSGRPAVPVGGRAVVIVDDGIATGATMRAAVQVVRARGASRVTVAVPVAAPSSAAELGPGVYEYVCVLEPEDLRGVGLWYDDFTQTTDAEVAVLLAGG